MLGCFYCESGETLDKLMVPVCALEYTRIYLPRNQNYPGRCVVAWKTHVRELYELNEREQAGFAYETALVAKAVSELFKADKINYGIFGDGVPHLHCHVVPKKQGGFTWGSPFLLSGNDDFPPEEELKARAAAIAAYIDGVKK